MGMRRTYRACSVTCAAVFLAMGATASEGQGRKVEEPNRPVGRANKHKIDAYIMLIRLRGDLYGKWKETGAWPDDKDANRALAAHGEYWEQQLKQGRAILAGGMKGDYWDNVAMIVFEAKSEAEAQELVKNDPAVKAFVFQAQLRPFDVHFLTNKYQTEP